MSEPEVFKYVTHRSSIEIKLPLWFRIRAWFWRRRPEIRTLRSEHFNLTVKRWWHRGDRKSARLALALMESNYDELSHEIQKEMDRAFLFGTGFVKKDWDPGA